MTTPRDLITQINALDTASLLERRGARLTTGRKRFSPCPACNSGGDKGRGVCLVVGAGGFWCSRCQAKGANVDILCHLELLDPAKLGPEHYDAMRLELGITEGERRVIQPAPVIPRPVERPAMNPVQVRRWFDRMRTGAGDATILHWLHDSRSLPWDGRLYPQLGTAIHAHQIPSTRGDIRRAILAGPAAAIPLFSLANGEVCNVLIRPVNPTVIDEGEKKPWKAKLLNTGPGTTRDGDLPLVYGSPVGALQAEVLVIVEGAIDQLTGQAMASAGVVVLGAFCAGDLPLLSTWLKGFRGRKIVLVPHMDRPSDEHPSGIGWARMLSLMDAMDAMAKGPALLLDWPTLLHRVSHDTVSFRHSGRSDLNDIIRRDIPGGPLATFDQLRIWWRELVEAP